MTKEEKYRHEYKYVVSDSEIAVLKERINKLITLDPHSHNGIYNISSLYFDDIYDSCFYENEDGTDPREKFRIRIYNHSSDIIKLECKRKERGKTLKTSCSISKEMTDDIINGKIPDINDDNPLLNKLIIQMKTRRLRPVVIVEYDRIPYIYNLGNVRITFDENLSSSYQIKDFFNDKHSKRPVMPKGYHLMEVKFDEFIPDLIYRALQIDYLELTNYSKYYLCRKFALQGGNK